MKSIEKPLCRGPHFGDARRQIAAASASRTSEPVFEPAPQPLSRMLPTYRSPSRRNLARERPLERLLAGGRLDRQRIDGALELAGHALEAHPHQPPRVVLAADQVAGQRAEQIASAALAGRRGRGRESKSR